MIWDLSSRSSRGLTALTEPWVPTGMNTGVSITPCAVVSWPRRAFVFLSVAFNSNIPGILEDSAVERQIFIQTNGEQFFRRGEPPVHMAMLVLAGARGDF